jgi:uncharacterized protein DUF2855
VSEALDFLVRLDDLRECKVAPATEPTAADLQDGQVLLRVDKFGFTSNNITYAVFGEAMRYWDFFPAPEGWGRVPVWGFADVIASKHGEIDEGERVFGYLPPSTHLVVQPDRVTGSSFVDASPHRAELPAVYQQYSRVAADPGYKPEHEDQQALLRPLYMTSMFAEDFLSDNGLFGAESAVLSSASSKTALGVAFLLSKDRPGDCEVIGLTSPGNVAFCERVGYYDRVLPYPELPSLESHVPTVWVDMAGDGQLLHDVHHHFGDSLRHSCIVGATHWEERDAQHDLPGPQPQFFFAPTQINKRLEDWGPGGIAKRYAEAWEAFLPSVEDWMKVVHGHGPEDLEAVYREVLEGKVDPEVGHMVSLGDERSG